MPLMPKRVKYRKTQRGSRAGQATRTINLDYGVFGLQTLERAWMTNTQIEAARVAMTRNMITLLAATLLPASVAFAQETTLFPHQKHARVFPVCEGCHAGIVTGVASEVFPKYDDCQACHDGTRVKQVAWREPRPRVSLLRFAHTTHRAALTRAREPATCLTCHAAGNPPRRMVVAGPDPARCLAMETAVLHQTNHMQLLSSGGVRDLLLAWL